MLKVVNDFGVTLHVIIVPTGFRSHAGAHEINEGTTVVEFFDTRSQRSYPPFGQFVARLPLSTILDAEKNIQLSILVSEWMVSQQNIEKICLYVKVHELI
jgi:hypothetical protein